MTSERQQAECWSDVVVPGGGNDCTLNDKLCKDKAQAVILVTVMVFPPCISRMTGEAVLEFGFKT